MKETLLRSKRNDDTVENPTMATHSPCFHKEGVIIPHLKLYIEVGTYLFILRNENGVERKRIGQFIDYELNYYGEKRFKFQIIPSMIIIYLVGFTRICDLAFVRYDNVPAGVENQVQVAATTTTFPCDSPVCPTEESTSKLVWHDLERIRVCVRRMLTSSSMQQANFACKRVVTHIGKSTFSYLRRNLEGNDGVTITPGRKHTQLIFGIGAGLTAGTERTVFDSTRMSFSGQNGIRALTSIFGNLAVIGLRRRRPRIDDPPQPLVRNDIVHYIVEEEGVVSVKFEYSQGTNRMAVAISYRPYVVAFNNDGGALNCPNVGVANAIGRRIVNNTHEVEDNVMEEDGNHQLVVVVDDEFTYQENQYSVRRVDGDRVFVVSLDFDVEIEVELPLADVGLLIREYNSES